MPPDPFQRLDQLVSEQRFAEAEALAVQAEGRFPGHPGILRARGRMALARRQFEAAAEAFGHATKGSPRDPELLCLWTEALLLARRAEEAVAAAETYATLVGPPNGPIFLASVHLKLRAYDRARTLLGPILEEFPGHHQALLCLAETQRLLGDFSASLKTIETALRLFPQEPFLLLRQGLALLQQGLLAKGFAAYEGRWRHRDWLARARWHRAPRWQGQPLDGGLLEVVADEGLGDTLQFARFLPRLAERFPLRLVAQPPLVSLLRRQPWPFQVLRPEEAAPRPAASLPLLSLPLVLPLALDALVCPRLLSPAEHPRPWSLGTYAEGRRRIGLVWAGNPAHTDDALRSIDPEALAPLADLPGLQWVSLQAGPRAGEARRLPFPVQDWTPYLQTFDDTAAALADLDGVLTVDTAVAHLSGALGRPTHLLLPLASDWRWFLGRTDSPWYPSVELHREKAAGRWETAVASAAAALGKAGAPG